MTIDYLSSLISKLPLAQQEEAEHLRDERLGILGVTAGMEPNAEQCQIVAKQLAEWMCSKRSLHMKVMVTGSRDWGQPLVIKQAIIDAKATEIIEGGQRGADTYAKTVANELGIPCRTFNADWGWHGKAAGPIRNQEMVDDKPDLVLAFPLENSSGTWDAVSKAKAAGIPVKIYNPSL